LHENPWCSGSEGHGFSCNYDIILYIEPPTGIFAISLWVHTCFLSYLIAFNTIMVLLYGHDEPRGMRLTVPWQFPYLCQKGVWGPYLTSQWVLIRFLSYCIGSNTIPVHPYGPEETRGMRLIVPFQFPYLCQTGAWGAYVIAQWVHIRFLSYWNSSNTIIVLLCAPKESTGTRFAVLSQFPYLCQTGVWGAYIISLWVPLCFLSYCIASITSSSAT
jgi:hypothetical protein